MILHSEVMLDLRDALDQVAVERKLQSTPTITLQRNLLLKARGWPGGLATFNAALHELRTACYVVLASLSGCRNHEIVFCKSNACYQTENDDGEKLWWMRSRSTKTDEAKTEWMIPEAAVRALNVMDRWARRPNVVSSGT